VPIDINFSEIQLRTDMPSTALGSSRKKVSIFEDILNDTGKIKFDKRGRVVVQKPGEESEEV